MTTERIDVLAVMDAVSNGIHYPEEGMISIAHHELYAFLEARAAVAELIEAADGVDATHGPMLNGPVDPKVQKLALNRLRAALARVGSP